MFVDTIDVHCTKWNLSIVALYDFLSFDLICKNFFKENVFLKSRGSNKNVQ